MSYRIFTFALLMGFICSSAFSQNWLFEKHAGGTRDDYGRQVAVDKDNNSYIIGEFSGDATFDTITISGEGKWNMFLAKYNPAGNVVWASTVALSRSPLSDIYANALALDSAGDIYIAGSFSADIDFSGTALQCIGPSDIYLAKFDNAGRFIWARRAGGTGVGTFGQDVVNAICVDAGGNCYLTGQYNRDAVFDTIAISSKNTAEVFIAKYDSAGRAIWVKSGGDRGVLHAGLGIGTDAAGNCYVTGIFFNKLAFDGYTLDAGDPEEKIFIAKLDAGGSVAWAHEVGSGGYYGSAQDIAVDRDGNSYIAGFFRAGIYLDGKEYSYNNGLNYAVLVVKHDAEGHPIWLSRTDGANQNGTGKGIDLDGRGNIFITGSFRRTIDFGATSLVNPSELTPNAFVAKMDVQGNWIQVRQISGPSNIYSESIAVNTTGECQITGTFADTISFDAENLTSSGGYDVFLAKLGDNGAGISNSGDDPTTNVLFYPNPATEVITLHSDVTHGKIRILSVDGIQLLETDYNQQIDVSGLAAGMYFVNVAGRTGKLVKLCD